MQDLTCELDRINERLGNEITKTLPAEFGDCSDWTSIAIYSKLLRIVSITAGSVFFGPEHCRDEKLIQLTVDYANGLFMSISRVKEWKPWTRWFGQFFIKELKDLQKARQGTEEYLIPIIQERRRKMAAGKETSNDCMQWMINEADESKLSDKELCEVQLDLSFASIQTTTLTVSYMSVISIMEPSYEVELISFRQSPRSCHSTRAG